MDFANRISQGVSDLFGGGGGRAAPAQSAQSASDKAQEQRIAERAGNGGFGLMDDLPLQDLPSNGGGAGLQATGGSSLPLGSLMPEDLMSMYAM
jgi:hypothetical protein